MNNAKRKTLALFASAVVLGAFGTLSAPTPGLAKTAKIYSEGGIAIDGTDAVAYFKQGKPVAGLPEFSHTWNGTKWLFSSEENRAAFAADPIAFAPQYGGYCAYAMASGQISSVDPQTWRIVEGRLYLLHNPGAAKLWQADIPTHVQRAGAHWSKALKR